MQDRNQVKQQELPPFLFNAWRFGQHHERIAKKNKELEGWTVSSLVETCLKLQLDAHKTLQETRARKKSIPPSLFSITAGKILEDLNKSDNPEADARVIADTLNTATLQHLLRDPRSTYRVLRAFHSLLPVTGTSSAQAPRRAIDIDEAILRNERYIRSRSDVENEDGKYLVRLSEFCTAVGACPDGPYRMKFTRMDPPKGGLEVLDERRAQVMCILPDDQVFVEGFAFATNGVLQGLDWANVLAAGGKVLSNLVRADDAKESDIDLYLYGLDAEQANQKVRHIYQVWSDNLPASNQEKLVVKNPKTINFLPSYPNCRVQIVLKLISSPTQALLNFDLDVCAIGFDGSRALMLPRCARAIETGYSVFTMDLIWGHHLSDRRETQQSRVFKYADRGFGLRILPSYAKSLEEDDLERQCRRDDEMVGEYDNEVGLWVSRDRKPDGSQEPGLKTLKRVAYLGRDYVRRFYFGTTPLAMFPNYPSRFQGQDAEEREDDWEDESGWGDHAPWHNEDAWKEAFARAERKNEEKRLRAEAGRGPKRPLINIGELDTRIMRQGLPDGYRGLTSFELFMRHCEAWRLDVVGHASLNREVSASIAYDEGSYDDLPTYKWNSYLKLDNFEESIDRYNDELFDRLKEAIRARLPGIHPFYPMTGFRDYLTRRIRRQVHGPNLESVLEKQITIPLIIPWDLENYILTQLPQDFPDLPTYVTERKALIPVHDTSKYNPVTAILPSLQDVASEKGNIRYWVITNTSMWAGQHRALDEIAEILWSLFHWFNQVGVLYGNQMGVLFGNQHPSHIGTEVKDCIWHIARACRRRMALPGIPSDDGYDHRISSAPGKSIETAVPTLRESLMFRPWVFHTPKRPEWAYIHAGRHQTPAHALFDENAVLYPFPDHLFWKEGDEGEWDKDGAPSWREVGVLDKGTGDPA